MKRKDLLTITTVALGTAALTVLAFWSGPLEAGNEQAALAPTIAQPKLVLRGVELTLAAADSKPFQAGDEAAFTLKAVNTGVEPVTVTAGIVLTASSPADMLSRVPRLPSILWQHTQSLALRAHETQTVALLPRVKLPGSSMIAVSLRESDPAPAAVPAPLQAQPAPGGAAAPPPGITALHFSTGKSTTELAATRQPQGEP